jgi:hypothetical protein
MKYHFHKVGEYSFRKHHIFYNISIWYTAAIIEILRAFRRSKSCDIYLLSLCVIFRFLVVFKHFQCTNTTSL